MPLPAWGELLGQIPSSYMYVHPLAIVGMVILFAVWVLFAQWVDKDAIAVNTYRQVWNMVTLSCGAASLLLLLLLPSFLFAALAFVVVNGALIIAYVTHRNGLVVEENKVLTAEHIKRVMSEGFSGKRKAKLMEVKELVKINAHDRRLITAPEDPIERAQYALAQNILFETLHRHASTLDLTPAGEQTKIRFGIDGIAMEREPMPRPDGEGFMLFIKRIAGLSLEERRKPQKGMIFAQVGDTRFEIVVRTTGSSAGEALVLRVIGPEKNAKVVDLGFSEQQLDAFRAVMYGERGLVLVTAMPGNGLSTTIFSVARSHDAFLQNIQMLEYEREIDIDNITQKIFTPTGENQFGADLLKIVRTDPNVVVLPEIRAADKQAAAVACEAGGRKQIVYVGVKSLDLFDGIQRFLHLLGDVAPLAKALACVTHQRLIRKLCDACKAPYKPDPALMQKINLPTDKILHRPPEPQFDKRGNPIVCPACQGTGYRGRTAVFTLLAIDDDMRAALKSGGVAALKTVAAKKGVVGLQQQALLKVLDGTTSIDEVGRAMKAAAPQPKPAAPKAAAST